MAAPFAIRGVMLDMARITERKTYYRDLLPWLAEWGYNLLHLHLTDDQGCALQFPSRPELATPNAFTVDEMREFVALARKHKLAVMPEIECLGHSRFITDQPRYKHLAEPGLEKSGFHALCPAHPETREILADLLRDAAGIFDYPVIHGGLDEVKFGECPRCRRKFGKAATEADRFAAHAAWVHAAIRRVGRRPAMWNDHVVKTNAMMKSFKRDVLMFHWDYFPDYYSHKTIPILEGGFEVMACPATVCWLTRLTPNSLNMANLRNASARGITQRKKGVVGFVNTVWCPWRYLPGALDFGLALGGHLARTNVEDAHFPELFVKSFYGVAVPRPIAGALTSLAACAPGNNQYNRVLRGVDAKIPFSREDQRACAIIVAQAMAIVRALKSQRRSVRRNLPRYDDVVLTAEALLAWASYGASGRKPAAAMHRQNLRQRGQAAWSRDRYADDPSQFGDHRHFGDDAFLWPLRRARTAKQSA